MFAVWCEMTVDPAKRAEYEVEQLVYMEKSRAEPGCRVFAFAVHPTDPSKTVSFQLWDDRSYHAAHLATPEHDAIIAAMPERGIKSFELRYLDVASCEYTSGEPSQLAGGHPGSGSVPMSQE